jgi:hypothetical protein
MKKKFSLQLAIKWEEQVSCDPTVSQRKLSIRGKWFKSILKKLFKISFWIMINYTKIALGLQE